ncbi:S1C family serine protease [Subtercola sp. YIM 133946]|uniref:S1C family serine protease n=1 Tax=Subtercola sp. YIM 133946 TaxID=3118909 RepID=UPI002F94DB6D
METPQPADQPSPEQTAAAPQPDAPQAHDASAPQPEAPQTIAPVQVTAQHPTSTHTPTPTHTHTDRIWRPRTFVILGAAAAALLVGGASVGATMATGIPYALNALSSKSSVVDSGTSGTTNGGTSNGYGSGSGSSGSTGSGNGFGYGGYGYGSGSGQSGSGQSGSTGSGTGTSAATAATDAQSVGIVLINTQLQYENAAAAGTGIVLTSDGEILTNNHVVEGSTSISVTVASTGKTYTATVVGTDATDDVAVLKLDGASGLTTAKLDTSDTVAAGDAVTGVGNAGGTGSLSAAAGTVDALNQSVTTEAEGSAASETLSGMIQISADIEAGDSGGPLLDSDGEVVGIDTAASSGTSDVTGFAIPINTALDIAKQILAGNASDSIVIGLPAFLGIEVGSADSGLGTQGGTGSTAGAAVAGVIDGTPAASAGLVAGDTITSVNGTAIASGTALTTALKAFAPGDSVTIGYTDATGATQSVSVTLVAGPAA